MKISMKLDLMKMKSLKIGVLSFVLNIAEKYKEEIA